MKEVAGLESKPVGHAALLRVLFKDRSHLRQVEADSRKMRVMRCDLHREIALGGPDIGIRAVLAPRELEPWLNPVIAWRKSFSRAGSA